VVLWSICLPTYPLFFASSVFESNPTVHSPLTSLSCTYSVRHPSSPYGSRAGPSSWSPTASRSRTPRPARQHTCTPTPIAKTQPRGIHPIVFTDSTRTLNDFLQAIVQLLLDKLSVQHAQEYRGLRDKGRNIQAILGLIQLLEQAIPFLKLTVVQCFLLLYATRLFWLFCPFTCTFIRPEIGDCY